MDTQKITQKTLVTSASMMTGVAFGSMSSRVVAEKLPLKNTKLKHGILAALGLAGAAIIPCKDNVGKAVRCAMAGMAATQGVELIKEFVKPKEGVFKTALGCPCNENVPIVIYDDRFAPSAIDVSFEEYHGDNPALEYMASPQTEFQLG